MTDVLLKAQHLERRQGKQLFRMAIWKLTAPHKTGLIYGPAIFENPYQTLLYSAFPNRVSPAPVRRAPLYRLLRLTNVYHMHWEEFRLKSDPQNPMRPDFCRPLERFQRLGGKLVWTVHNQQPHAGFDADRLKLFDKGRQFLCDSADIIHVHSAAAQEFLTERYRVDPNRIMILEHPSYLGWYPSTELPDMNETVSFVAFGSFRENKGLELILSGFRKITNPERFGTLHIAGRDASLAEYHGLTHLNIRMTDGFIPDEQLSDLFMPADFCVFGFQDILTSGSLILPLGFGCVPIAPNLPTIREALPPELHLFLYTPGDADDLARLLQKVTSLSKPDRKKVRLSALAHAQKLHPQNISAQLYQKIQGLFS